MPDVFAWNEDGALHLINLNGRSARPFLITEHPVLRQRDAAAELTHEVMRIIAKYSQAAEEAAAAETAEILARKKAAPRIQATKRRGGPIHPGSPTSAEVLAWLASQPQPVTLRQLKAHYSHVRGQTIQNRMQHLANNIGRIRYVSPNITVIDPSPLTGSGAPGNATADTMLEYVRRHPGLTAGEIRDGMRIDLHTYKITMDVLRSKRKALDLVHAPGHRQGGRYYVKGTVPAMTPVADEQLWDQVAAEG